MLQESDRGVTFAVHVTPRARKDEIGGLHGDAIKVRITAPPVEGAANAHLVKFLAEVLGVPSRQVTIVAGETSRRKVVAVMGVPLEAVRERLLRGVE